MRSTFAAAALAAAIASFTATGASAQTGAGTAGPSTMGQDGGAMHGGGWYHEGRHGWGGGAMRLTPEERHKLIAARFALMDTNHDGRVSFEEFKAYRERMRAERQRDHFRRLAGGGDALTLERLEALSAGHGGGGEHHQGVGGWGTGGWGSGGMGAAGRTGAR